MKLAVVILPFEIVHVGLLMMLSGVLAMLQDVSAVLNPLPKIVTAVPAGPVLGTRVIVGAGEVTVNVALAKSPLLPVAVMV